MLPCLYGKIFDSELKSLDAFTIKIFSTKLDACPRENILKIAQYMQTYSRIYISLLQSFYKR